MVLVGIALLIAAFGYRSSQFRWCSGCWASMQRTEYGLALAHDVRLPLWTSDDVHAEPAPGVARFLPSGHVHDAALQGIGSRTFGPFLVGYLACCGPVPSEFATALGDDEFADFVASRVTGGSVSVETVRSLITIPSARIRDESDEPEPLPLMRRGCELYAAFDHADPVTCTLWGGPLPPSVWDRR
jgi:hypothetical protein